MIRVTLEILDSSLLYSGLDTRLSLLYNGGGRVLYKYLKR